MSIPFAISALRPPEPHEPETHEPEAHEPETYHRFPFASPLSGAVGVIEEGDDITNYRRHVTTSGAYPAAALALATPRAAVT